MVGGRRLILFGLLMLDLATLSLATAWVATRATTPPDAIAISAAAGRTSPKGVTPSVGLPLQSPTKIPVQASSFSDRRLTGGPKFCVAAAFDHEGTAWIGTEDQGVWCSQGGDNWLSYGPGEGLADPDATAIVCDAVGRVWVGHNDHGLSIYDGQTWRTYDRLAGPGASHIFCLATCPTDGDVWMGTDAGLTRYSLKHDTWTTFDRGTGLPAAEVTCLSFDSAGNLFAGFGSEGLGIAHAADGYVKWVTVTGPDDLPIVASGPGLPSSLVNAVLVTRDDTVYVGTCHGLARSVDHGSTWTYVRGKNWPQLSRGRYDGTPANFTGLPAGPLLEDWVSALVQDPAGVLWVGCREVGFEAFSDLNAAATYQGKGRVSALAGAADGTIIAATYGDGVVECGTTYAAVHPTAKPIIVAPSTDVFPTPAPVPAGPELDALCRQVKALPTGKDGVEFLGDDWDTGGDWCARYGGQVRQLLSYHNFTDPSPTGFGYSFDIGPYRSGNPWYYYTFANANRRALVDPRDGRRIFGECNDGGYLAQKNPRWRQGPDLYLTVTVPAGVHRVSLCFNTADGHSANRAYDYSIDVKRIGEVGDDDPTLSRQDSSARMSFTTHDDVVTAELAPTLSRTRVLRFWRPVYKQFLIRGGGHYAFRIGRNGSSNTKVSGLFVDRLDGPADPVKGYPHLPEAKDYTADLGPRGSAARLWSALDAACGRRGYAAIASRARDAAYFAGAAAGIDVDTLARWRSQMPLWLSSDRDHFDDWLKTLPKPASEK